MGDCGEALTQNYSFYLSLCTEKFLGKWWNFYTHGYYTQIHYFQNTHTVIEIMRMLFYTRSLWNNKSSIFGIQYYINFKINEKVIAKNCLCKTNLLIINMPNLCKFVYVINLHLNSFNIVMTYITIIWYIFVDQCQKTLIKSNKKKKIWK